MHKDLVPGKHLPDLELPDHNGHPRRLTELAGGDPLVVNFFRGFWCPKEQAFFRRMVALQDEAEVAYTRFGSVSIDPPEVSAAFRAGLDARWTFLSDTERRHQGELELLETTDTVHRPYLPVTFSLYPDLRIHAVYNGYWFWGSPTNEQLRTDLREITRAIRPDWEVPS
jgi:peroxiredoxin